MTNRQTVTWCQIAIIIFCLWHMLAVAVYSFVRDQESLYSLVRPYVLATSQWQRWNLFSPDPLRRVTAYTFETQRGSGWETFEEHSADTVPWWSKAVWLKLMRRLDEENAVHKRVRERIVHLACAEHQVPPGSIVRMRRQYYVIPRAEELASRQWWRTFTPEWQEKLDDITLCPHPT